MVEPRQVCRRSRMIFNHYTKRNNRAFKWFSEKPYMMCFPICQEIMNISQIATAFHRTSTPFFTADIPSKTLRTTLSAMPFVSDRWSVEVRRFHDNHRICQIPMNGQCQWLSAFPTARETSENSFPSLEKFLFCTDKIGYIDWLNLAPRLSIGDCFEIHLPRWGLCDLVLSSHQIFLPDVLLRQFAFCKEPLLSCFTCRIHNFGLLGVPLSLDVPKLSHEKCVRLQALLCLQDFLWTPLTTPGGLASGFPLLVGCPCFMLVWAFLDGSCRCRRRTCAGAWRQSRDNNRHEIFSLAWDPCPNLWSVGAFDRWPTHMHNRALRRVLQAMELQACPRVCAPSRRDQDCKQKTCASSLDCTSPLAVVSVVRFLDFRSDSSSPELKSFSHQHVQWCSGIDHEFSLLLIFEEGAGIATAPVGE